MQARALGLGARVAVEVPEGPQGVRGGAVAGRVGDVEVQPGLGGGVGAGGDGEADGELRGEGARVRGRVLRKRM